MQEMYPYVFSGDEGKEENKEGMIGIIRNLPNDKFGPMDKIEKMYIHNVLYHADQLMKEAQKQKANDPHGIH